MRAPMVDCIMVVFRCFIASLFDYLQKRRRPSRSDGGCCEKGVSSSGEKTAWTALPSVEVISSH
jgi:hypothetical protein